MEISPDGFGVGIPSSSDSCLGAPLRWSTNRFAAGSSLNDGWLISGSFHRPGTKNFLKGGRGSRWRRRRWREASRFSIFVAGSWSKRHWLRQNYGTLEMLSSDSRRGQHLENRKLHANIAEQQTTCRCIVWAYQQVSRLGTTNRTKTKPNGKHNFTANAAVKQKFRVSTINSGNAVGNQRYNTRGLARPTSSKTKRKLGGVRWDWIKRRNELSDTNIYRTK